ncbi:hypothetical protein AAZX31_12G124200 [Glycine max]
MAKKHGAFVFELMPLEEFCFRFRTSSYSGNWKPNVSKAARVLNLQCTERVNPIVEFRTHCVYKTWRLLRSPWKKLLSV